MDWLTEQVLDPIGFRYAGWYVDPAGNPMMSYGAWTTGAEWLRFGVLLRDDGLWQGAQVLPVGSRDACTTGSAPNPAYGLATWMNQEVPPELDLSNLGIAGDDGPILYSNGHTDLFMAAGARGQRLYILPAEDMVVAVLSDSRDFTDADFLAQLFGDG